MGINHELNEVQLRLEEQVEEGCRRDEQMRQQNELLTQLLARLNEAENRPPPPPLEQPCVAPAEPVRNAAENPAVRARRDTNEAPLVAPIVGEPVYERFRCQKPPSFSGTPDPAKAEDWYKKLQHIFGYMRLTDEERVACAVNQLEGEAFCWWEVVLQSERIEQVTWDKFLDLFRRKYLGEARLSGKVREFMELKQGKLSVAEYTARFDELARFAPSMVPTDDARRMKYMHGLSIDIVKQVDSGETGPRSYADAVQQALRIDRWDEKTEKSQTAKASTQTENRAMVPFRGNKGHY